MKSRRHLFSRFMLIEDLQVHTNLLLSQVGILNKEAPKSLEHCLRLFYYKVSGGDGGGGEEEERMQQLSLDQLRELNSKLMLITAGSEGKKDVERFSRSLGLLELVGRHFLELLLAGCHLFTLWTMKVSVHMKRYLSIGRIIDV